ncbi:MAG: GH3 auxin-responsive promoter family protein [Nitrospirota bacterium]|nr:GH3 auxin-responsive promoter family protein [Nitrospirota bacterium]
MNIFTFGHNARMHVCMMMVKYQYWNPFIKHTHDPQGVQQALLERIVKTQAETTYGRKYQFSRLRGYHEFRFGVPIQTYEDVRPYLQAQEATKGRELNDEQPISYAVTSGTTGQPKMIPILPRTPQMFRHYQLLSTYAQYQGIPKIFQGKMLVIAGQEVEGYLESGTSYGSMSGMLTSALPSMLQPKRIVPDLIERITEYQQKYLYLAAWALAEPNLSVVATANPSTFLKLLEVGRQHFSQLVEQLESDRKKTPDWIAPFPRLSRRRLRYLQSLVGQEDQLTVEALWPKLKAVVTWTGGSCGALIPSLKAKLSAKTAIVEMGYLSSEFLGSLNVDVQTNQCVPTFHENFFEFVEQADWDADRPNTLTLDQLEPGKRYYVLVTTMNGLYRYLMNDLIEVTGWFHRTPTIRFVQKGKGVTNLTGEKLYEFHVMNAVEAIQEAYQTTVEFYVMLADPLSLQYTLYLEHPPLDFFVGYKLEQHMGEANVEFQAKRASERLQPLRVVYVRPGTGDAYKAHSLQQGQRDAQFKVIRLQYSKDCSFDFSDYVRA